MTKALSLLEQQRFCQLLAALLEAGFSLKAALDYLTLAIPNQKTIWRQIQSDLAEGQSLATILGQQKFSPMITTQVALAEVHGQLGLVLTQLAQYLTLVRRQRQHLSQLLLYPAILFTLLIGLQMMITYFVLPTLGTSQAMNYWPLMGLAGLGGLYMLSRKLSASTRLKLALRLPVVKGFWQTYYQYQFLSGASLFLAAGQDFAQYCQYLTQVDALALSQVGRRITAQLQAGMPLSQALNTPLVPVVLPELLMLGQPPALVVEAIKIMTNQLFTQLQQRLERLLTFVQPLLFLGLGIQIVLTYLQVLAPMYQLMEV